MSPAGTNWGGNVAYRASRVARPQSIGALAELCAGAERLAVVASRHSFSRIGDGDVLVDMSALTSEPVVDRAAASVTVSASNTYAQLARSLHASECGLHNLASLPHISVGGAVATATHGSGSELANLASAVREIELMTSAGELVRFTRGDDDFDGVVVGLGALGVVTRLVLDVEATYDVSQTVFDGLDWPTLVDSFDALFSAATSVSVFTTWGDEPGEVWMKRRSDDDRDLAAPDGFGLVAADGPRHPIPGADGAACTEQLGRPGPWWQRLPHFRADAEPSAGAEIQSEVFVDRLESAAAIEALRSIGSRFADDLLVGEIRTIAADDQWMSPHFERASTGFHFTWKPDQRATQAAVDLIAESLAPFAPRFHLGKVIPTGWHARGAVERLDDFLGLAARVDPASTFATPWFQTHIA